MHLILMIDTSGSMQGQKIGSVTDAMENIISDLSSYDDEEGGALLAIEFFSRTVRWANEDFIKAKDYTWKEPVCTGMTSLGGACLSLSDFMSQRPVDDCKLLLISDGCPTDDYDEGINRLDGHSAFQAADKYAIAIGGDADLASLVRFTGDTNHVFTVTDLVDLLSMMKRIITPDNADKASDTPPIKPNPEDGDDEWS